jgi:hypothetical protein
LAERFVAFDQDAASLAEVEAMAVSKAVEPIPGSISRLIAGRHDFSDFDLVYAAGLFDYLEDRTAKAADGDYVRHVEARADICWSLIFFPGFTMPATWNPSWAGTPSTAIATRYGLLDQELFARLFE